MISITETKPNEGFINESNLEFNDISSELERTYTFPNGNKYHIIEPLYLNVSKSGGHRLYSADGLCHYVQPKEGWAISWKVKEGKPSFVK